MVVAFYLPLLWKMRKLAQIILAFENCLARVTMANRGQVKASQYIPFWRLDNIHTQSIWQRLSQRAIRLCCFAFQPPSTRQVASRRQSYQVP